MDGDEDTKESREAKALQVRILGPWNFTLQCNTPLYWLRCGELERYLLKMRVRSPCPSTTGVVIHTEADSAGMQGVSFWIERRESGRRYFLAGNDLDSTPVVTREYPDDGDQRIEDIEVLMQGASGCVFLQERFIKIKFQLRRPRGALAFYNSTRGDDADVHFSHVQITNLQRGAPQLAGSLGSREEQIKRMAKEYLPNEIIKEEAPAELDEDPPQPETDGTLGEPVEASVLEASQSVKKKPKRKPLPEPARLKLPIVCAPPQDRRMLMHVPALKSYKRRSASDSALHRTR